MAQPWKPEDIVVVMAASTGCLCLMVVVIGAVLGVLLGSVSVEALGSIGTAGAATGLGVFGLLAFWVIRLAIEKGDGK